jgi:hypothetical protein
MDFGNILPVIIVAIYIYSLFGKKKADGKETPVPEKSPLKIIFQTLAKQLKQYAETVKKNEERQMKHQPSPEKRVLPKTRTMITADKKKEIMPDLSLEADEILEEVLLDIPTGKIDKKKKMENRLRQSASPKNIRNAMAWSEILGPPVALKKNQRTNF